MVAFLGGPAVPEGQVPLSLSALIKALTLESGSIGLKCFTVPSVSGVKQVAQVKQLFFGLGWLPDEDVILPVGTDDIIALGLVEHPVPAG